jgi:CBS domain-containing protein
MRRRSRRDRDLPVCFSALAGKLQHVGEPEWPALKACPPGATGTALEHVVESRYVVAYECRPRRIIMKVQDSMTTAVRSCRPTATLAEATAIMWEADCGIVPVVNETNEVRGVITDRDIAIALGSRGTSASALRVGDVMSKEVVTCTPADTIIEALALMQKHRVRRLPVVGIGGVLLGVLSLNDVVLHGPAAAAKDPVIATLRGVCAHRRPTPVARAS